MKFRLDTITGKSQRKRGKASGRVIVDGENGLQSASPFEILSRDKERGRGRKEITTPLHNAMPGRFEKLVLPKCELIVT